ncbi:hypothetical protein LTR87_016632 [Friedmanniomyces endolithicus]|nr:hypothetical protein LTR87_016632 [Friedmanniomyces endolithicus]
MALDLDALDFEANWPSEDWDYDRSVDPDAAETITFLEDAIKAGRFDSVQEIFEHPEQHRLSERPGSALFFAVQLKHHDIVSYLLQHGIKAEVSHAKVATIDRDIPALELLLQHGWAINEPLEWAVPPALAFAVEDAELTAWFLAHGTSPNARCYLDITPFSAAVQYAPLSTIHTMFEHGGSIVRGQLLHYAVWRKLDDRLIVMTFLLSQNPPIDKVMYYDLPECYEQQKRFSLGTALHDAAAAGDLPIVGLLVANGFNLSTRDSLGRLPLERARENHHEAVAEYLQALSR